MYLHGLKDIFTDEAQAAGDPWLTQQSEGDVWGGGGPVYGGVVAPSSQPPTDNSDWTRVISSAITTFGNFATAKLQSKTAIATAPYSNRYAPYYLPGSTGAYGGASPSPFTYSTGLSGTTILLGAAAIAAFLLLRR